MDVFGRNAVGDHRSREIWFYVEPNAFFRAWSDEIFHEIHAAPGTHPFPIRVRIIRLDEYVGLQENVTVERQVAKRGKPRRRGYQLVSDNQRHRSMGLQEHCQFRHVFDKFEPRTTRGSPTDIGRRPEICLSTGSGRVQRGPFFFL